MTTIQPGRHPDLRPFHSGLKMEDTETVIQILLSSVFRMFRRTKDRKNPSKIL